MTTLMLCAIALTVSACGQKRPLQLPAKRTTPAATAPVPAAAPAASAASAAN